METTLQSLAERVSHLERSGRRWRRTAITLGLLAIAGAAPATQPAAVEVRTRRLVLVDEHDRPAAVLWHKDGDGCGLVFVDPANPKVVVSSFGWAADGSGMVQINTRDGRMVVSHTGEVTDQGVPLERVRAAQALLNRAIAP